ncbi:PP2C family protein-serine/threonine phosphatase [Aestuariimicrobium ganziense]|uniref:PP2C family protein-serine/threonine phosphatase n=1 Tax=Aestuariimicrobium ganziense TaxID=2773677 RepID=UPI0019415210|nr:protein phosphatase 2C domain-containing protein [Aestuariimicrobium ganziense]
MTFSLDFRAHSEVGLVRKNNQDSGFASPTMLVVADGMGGAAAGDLASTVAINEVEQIDIEATGEELLTTLAGAVARANDTIADLVARDHSLDGMGTTVCGAMFDGRQLGLVHIGDSRGYLFRDGSLVRLTHDHSWVQSLIDEGRITEEEAAIHPHRSLVLKVLNGHPTHSPDTELIEVHEGDRVLFCSDGLCGFTTDDTIAEILAEDDLDVVMADLVQAAHLGGGADNITIVLADVVPHDEALGARTPVVLGAAASTTVPDLDELAAAVDLGDDEAVAAADESPVVPKAPVPVAAHTDDEQARYQPTLRRRRRWVPVLLALVLALVTGSSLYGGWAWAKTQYYVGENDGHVAIYNGIEGSVLGRPLATVVETTDIEVAGLPRVYRQQVSDTIKTSTLDAARSTVQRLQTMAGTCPNDASPSPRPSGSAVPSGSATGTTSPSPGTSPSGSGLPSGGSTGSGSPSASFTGSAAPAPPEGEC